MHEAHPVGQIRHRVTPLLTHPTGQETTQVFVIEESSHKSYPWEQVTQLVAVVIHV